MGSAPISSAIDTHWHFDHADNNADFRNARRGDHRAREHEEAAVGVPRPARHALPARAGDALPTQTFTDTHTLNANGERFSSATSRRRTPTPTSTSTSPKANVLHLGDVFFNGMYPFIDATTGGNINGMIAAAGTALKLADAPTKIVPGHGPLGDLGVTRRTATMLVDGARSRREAEESGQDASADVAGGQPTTDLRRDVGQGLHDA